MIMPSFGMIVVFLLGVFVGTLIGNRNFRIKFFIELRKFLMQLNQGARAYNKGYSRRPSSQRQRQSQQQESPRRVTGKVIEHHVFHETELKQCPRCGGNGRISKKLPSWARGIPGVDSTEVCPDCDGTGKIYK